MKKIFLVLSILLTTVASVFAQDMPGSVDEVINWSFDVEYGECNDARIVITVDQKDGWHIYAQKQPEGGISFPTELNFAASDDYVLVGKAKEYGAILKEGQFPEKVFDGEKAIFKQKIRLKSQNTFKINGTVEYMVCTGENCLPPKEIDLEFTVN